MTKWQVLRLIEMPLALSVIMAGIRNALVIAIGVAAIGTFVEQEASVILLYAEQMQQMVLLLF